MKIVNITLGRDYGYSTLTANVLASNWKASMFVASAKGSGYPDEKEIPADIAEAMAQAAFTALEASGFFTPSFESSLVPLPVDEIEPVAEPVNTRGPNDPVEF